MDKKGELYLLADFIADALGLMLETDDEKELLESLAPLALRVISDPALRSAELYQADLKAGYGTTVLHAEQDNSLFIVADCWLPGRGVAPHNHGCWAIVVGLDGSEKNTFWERSDDETHSGSATLTSIGSRTIGARDLVSMTSDDIHSVRNESQQTTLSFHVYGRHLNHGGRSIFDPERHTEKPFVIQTR